MRQEGGIKQGSALSPSIFVLVLGFVLKEAQEYCLKEDKRLSWRAYTDDVCLIGDNYIEIGLKALQAAIAYIGLSFNVKKCEGMFLNFTTRIETTKEEAKKEKIVISSKNGMIQGWITKKKFKSLMIPYESPQNEEDEEMTHVMLKDEGGVEFTLLKKGGWCRRKMI